jgi:hypothetical protein
MLNPQITHVKLTSANNTAWCGEVLGVEKYFGDAEQAALNGLYDVKKIICEKCVKLISFYLHEGMFINDNNEGT